MKLLLLLMSAASLKALFLHPREPTSRSNLTGHPTSKMAEELLPCEAILLPCWVVPRVVARGCLPNFFWASSLAG